MFAKALVTLAVAVSVVVSQALTISTPAAYVQCQPVSIQFAGGTPPYIIAVIPGEQTSAPAIATLSTSLTSSPYTWIVDLAAGTFITLRITDGAGSVQYNTARTIQAGASDSCLNASASTSGLETTGAITTTGTGSATLSGTASGSAPAGSTTSAAASSAASSAAASSAAGTSATSRPASSVQGTSSTPVSSAPASSAPAASPTGGAMSNAVIGVPALAAALAGGIAMLL